MTHIDFIYFVFLRSRFRIKPNATAPNPNAMAVVGSGTATKFRVAVYAVVTVEKSPARENDHVLEDWGIEKSKDVGLYK